MEHTVLFSEQEIAEKVGHLANAIDRDAPGPLVIVTVLKGAVIFSSDLVRAMATETEWTYMSASSYVEGFTPGETLTVTHDPVLGVRGRHVLIVEDIVDTGRTLQELGEAVQREQPRTVKTVALINKTDRRSEAFEPTYSGFDISGEFIYGYGLDWNQRFRDLPYIAIANP